MITKINPTKFQMGESPNNGKVYWGRRRFVKVLQTFTRRILKGPV